MSMSRLGELCLLWLLMHDNILITLTFRRGRVPDSSSDLAQHVNRCKAMWIDDAISPIDDEPIIGVKVRQFPIGSSLVGQ
jgi:hypothetical protein